MTRAQPQPSVGSWLGGAARGFVRAVATADDPPAPVPSGRFTSAVRRTLRTLGFVLAAYIVLVSIAVSSTSYQNPLPVCLALSLAAALPLVLAPYRPLVAWRIAMPTAVAIAVVNSAPHLPWSPGLTLGFLVTVWQVASRHERAVSVWVWLLSTAAMSTYLPPRFDVAAALGVTAVAALGDQVRRRRLVQQALVAEEERSELERTRNALLAERARIARELHDVVAHHMSMIVVRAQTAPYRITGVPEECREEFTALGDMAREALTEMRRLLGVLRDNPDAVATAPQPGADQIGDLVDSARRAGVQVTADGLVGPAGRGGAPGTADGLGSAGRGGAPGTADELVGSAGRPAGAGLPAGVDLSAYRIVQEALSNARRHAPGAPVHVALRRADRALHVSVVNGAVPGRRPPAGGRTGHGLVGMRERVTMLGGTLVAGPTDDGGFAVEATLPLDPATSPNGPATSPNGPAASANGPGGSAGDPATSTSGASAAQLDSTRMEGDSV